MPELPEVETVARQLSPDVEGLALKNLIIHDEKLSGYDWSRLLGRRVSKVARVGKQVLFRFGSLSGLANDLDSDLLLTVHLRMTGRLLWIPSADAGDLTHIRAEFVFDKGLLLFQDIRRFGVLKLHETIEEVQPAGVDPLAKNLTSLDLQSMLSGSKQQIKAWLLRQDRLVGLGNIYASEILFDSRIHPEKLAGELTYDEIKRLFRSTRNILRKAIKNCGTTFSDFQDSRGEQGAFQNFLKVYQKADQPCVVCGDLIKKIKQQQRSTFFCPSCQRIIN